MLVVLLLFFSLPLVFAGPPSGGSTGCFPPSGVAEMRPECGHGYDTQYSCSGAAFTKTSGFWWNCGDHSDCYSLREPNEWCHLPRPFQWTEKGCFCDRKLGSCIIERSSGYERQWAYCIPQNNFICDVPSGKCAN